MPNIFDFPPLVQRVMRTGVMPSHSEIAAATGKSVDEVKRVLEGSPAESDDAGSASAEDPEAQRLRDEYQKLEKLEKLETFKVGHLNQPRAPCSPSCGRSSTRAGQRRRFSR